MNNSIEYFGLYWMNIFLNEYFGFCFEWIFFWMNILDFVLNWILNWIIFRPNSMKKWIFKTYRLGLPHPPFFDLSESYWGSSGCLMGPNHRILSYYFSVFLFLLSFCLNINIAFKQSPHRWRSCHRNLLYQLVYNFINVYAYFICCDAFIWCLNVRYT